MTEEQYKIEILRLERRLRRKDKKIAGLVKANTELTKLLAQTPKNFQYNLEKALERTLCNVRMIPVLGFKDSDRIVEVKVSGKDE